MVMLFFFYNFEQSLNEQSLSLGLVVFAIGMTDEERHARLREKQLSRAFFPPQEQSGREAAQSGQGGGAEKSLARRLAAFGTASMAEAIGARLVRNRFFRGFVSGAALGATVSGLLANKLLRNPDRSPSAAASEPEEPLPTPQPPLGGKEATAQARSHRPAREGEMTQRSGRG